MVGVATTGIALALLRLYRKYGTLEEDEIMGPQAVIPEHYPALIVVTPLVMSFIVFAAGLFNRRICFPWSLPHLPRVFISASVLAQVMQRQPHSLLPGRLGPTWASNMWSTTLTD